MGQVCVLFVAGHQGQPRTLSLARQRFFWLDMERDVRDYVKKCPRCVLSKTPEPAARDTLESIQTTAPLELVCIDFWSAEDGNNKSVDVLVITDHFTKLAHAFPCQDQTAKRVAKNSGTTFSAFMDFPNASILTRGLPLRVSCLPSFSNWLELTSQEPPDGEWWY